MALGKLLSRLPSPRRAGRRVSGRCGGLRAQLSCLNIVQDAGNPVRYQHRARTPESL